MDLTMNNLLILRDYDDTIHMYLGEKGLCYSQVKFFYSCFYRLQ